jgi:hypothetical protein
MIIKYLKKIVKSKIISNAWFRKTKQQQKQHLLQNKTDLKKMKKNILVYD